MKLPFKLIFLMALVIWGFKSIAQIQLQNPEQALSLIASDSTRAKQFYLNCLGLTNKGSLTIPGLTMFLFGSGQATVKVRVYNSPPPPQNTNLTAANGFRFISIPVNNFDSVLIRLNTYSFPAPVVTIQDSIRTGMACDGDGNVVEIIDLASAPERKLEVGLLVSEADSSIRLYQNILGLPVAPAAAGPSPLDSATEYRYEANNTILRLFVLPGNRPSDTAALNAILGYRYITFTLAADVDLLYQTMIDSGIVIVTPLSPYGSTAYLFMVRGPGGALHEFIGPLHVNMNTAFTDMEFIADYYAPGLPPDDDLAKTLEANALEIHNGKLYCSTTYAGPNGVPSTSDPKILVKDSADGNWTIDYHGGNKFVRFPILKSVNFTSDANGNDLDVPVPVLVAGTGAWRSWNPDGVYVISRNDSLNQWFETKLSDQCWNIENSNHGCEVRMIFDHRDVITGIHYVFAGAYSGALYRGWYNPLSPGLIEWDPVPEIDSLLGHVLCSATINDTVYIGMSFGESSGVPSVWRPFKDYGIWKRMDGERMPVHGHDYDPNDDLQWRWIEIEDWEDPLNPGEHLRMGQFRGLTAIPDPNGGNHQVLGFHWDSPDNLIEIVDPVNGYQNTVELGSKAFLQSLWGSSAYCITLGYNDWLPAVHPITNDSVHLIGAWAQYPGGEVGSPEGKSSWFFVRYQDASYNVVRIWDYNNTLDTASNGLKGCRSIRPSPFPEEAGNVWYFSGFDLTGPGTSSVVGNKAWIYKGVIDMQTGLGKIKKPEPGILLYPNPAGSLLSVLPPIESDNNFYEIFNLTGKTVLSGSFEDNSISIENLKPGLFFIRIFKDKKIIGAGKFIKK